MTNYEQIEKFIDLKAIGSTYSEMEQAVEVARRTLFRWNVKYKMQITVLRKERRKALLDKIELGEEKRLLSLKGDLQLIDEELKKRNYRDVRTEQLLKMKIHSFQQVENAEKRFDRLPENRTDETDEVDDKSGTIMSSKSEGTL